MMEVIYHRVQSDVRSLLQVVIAFVVLYAFGAVDELVRRLVMRVLAEYWDTNVRIAALSVWAMSGRVDFDGVAVETWRDRGFDKRKESDAVQVSKAVVFVDLRKAWSRLVFVEGARVRKIRLVLMRRKDGTLNVEFFARKKRQTEQQRTSSEPTSPGSKLVHRLFNDEEDDDWVDVSESLKQPNATTSEEETTSPSGKAKQLWSLLSTAASEAEKHLRSKTAERSILEDAALYAIDAAQQAKSEVEVVTDQAKRWARDRARASLKDALKLLFDRAEQKNDSSVAAPKWSIVFSAAATLEVTEFVVELLDARGRKLIDPPLVFEDRKLTDLRNLADPDPARVLLRLGRLLTQSCVEDLVDRRPDDAARLATAIAKQLADDTKRVAKTKFAKLATSAIDAFNSSIATSPRGSLHRLANDDLSSFADRPDDDDDDDIDHQDLSWPTSRLTNGESF